MEDITKQDIPITPEVTKEVKKTEAPKDKKTEEKKPEAPKEDKK